MVREAWCQAAKVERGLFSWTDFFLIYQQFCSLNFYLVLAAYSFGFRKSLPVLFCLFVCFWLTAVLALNFFFFESYNKCVLVRPSDQWCIYSKAFFIPGKISKGVLFRAMVINQVCVEIMLSMFPSKKLLFIYIL